MKKSMRMRWISLLAAVSLAVAVPAPVAAAKTGTASSSSEAESESESKSDTKIFRGHPKAFTFRGLEWGASHEEIMKSGILDGLEEEIDYQYDDEYRCLTINTLKALGKDTISFLYFNDDDQFCLAIYMLTEDHADSQGDYLDFSEIEDALKQKYGKPLIVTDKWINDFYKGQEDKYGLAISLGELRLFREWDAKDTSCIRMTCGGDNYETVINIGYVAPNSIPQSTDSEDDGL